MRAEGWVVFEIDPVDKYRRRPRLRLTKLLQKQPQGEMAFKLIVELDETKWWPTVEVKLDPVEVHGAVDTEEARRRAQRMVADTLE